MFKEVADTIKSYYLSRKSRKSRDITEHERQIICRSEPEKNPRLATLKEDRSLLLSFRHLCKRAKLSYQPKLIIYNDNYPNAYCLSTGAISISTGLISLLDQREIDFVLAHEIAHLRQEKQTLFAKLTATASPILLGGVASFQSVKNSFSKSSLLSNSSKACIAFVLVYKAVKIVADSGMKYLKRSNELKADESGVLLTGDIEAARSAFYKAKSYRENNDIEIPVNAHHPNAMERVSHLEKLEKQKSVQGAYKVYLA